MYEPQEDSLMLKEVVEKFLFSNPKKVCVDMGAGSGIQGFAMEKFCERVIFSDVNLDVINYLRGKVKGKNNFLVVESDLFDNLNDFVGGCDLIVFNPPYLPRESEEVDDLELTSGVSGIDITCKFVIQSKKFLSREGRLFFVVSSLSDIDSLNETLKSEGFKFEIAKSDHFFFEDIMIYEAWLDA